MNEFDELFNQHFGNNNKNEKEEAINKMLNFIGKLNKGGGESGLNPEEGALGKPDSIREFDRDGVSFIESTWETPVGSIVRIETKEEIEFTPDFFKRNGLPTGKSEKRVKITLQERLDIAKKEEDYELCAKLRDAIIAKEEEKIAGENKNNKGIPKKDKKDLSSENLDNKGFPRDDEWNF